MMDALVGRASAGLGRVVRRAVGLAIAGLLVAAVGALAAAHLRSGALYTGKDSACGSSVPGATCTFKFRASANGRSLRFVGKTVVDTWGCQGGGGEALLGGTLTDATPIPLVKLRTDGTLHGSVGFVSRPAIGQPESYTSKVTGHLSRAGKAAVITFHLDLNSTGSACATQPVKLAEVGTAQGGAH